MDHAFVGSNLESQITSLNPTRLETMTLCQELLDSTELQSLYAIGGMSARYAAAFTMALHLALAQALACASLQAGSTKLNEAHEVLHEALFRTKKALLPDRFADLWPRCNISFAVLDYLLGNSRESTLRLNSVRGIWRSYARLIMGRMLIEHGEFRNGSSAIKAALKLPFPANKFKREAEDILRLLDQNKMIASELKIGVLTLLI